ncbi:WD domain, G-beta repeat-containing protein, partial [Toxoplasma gondii ARI]
GQTCKFGTAELSDILSFVELADGWLLAGSEYGQLLLWEGSLLKAEVKQGVAAVLPGASVTPARPETSGQSASPVSALTVAASSCLTSAAACSSGAGRRPSLTRDEKPSCTDLRARRASSRLKPAAGLAALSPGSDARRSSRRINTVNDLPSLPREGTWGHESREPAACRLHTYGSEREAAVVKHLPCHEGPITSVFRDPNAPDKIVTAGHDGHIK